MTKYYVVNNELPLFANMSIHKLDELLEECGLYQNIIIECSELDFNIFSAEYQKKCNDKTYMKYIETKYNFLFKH